MVQDLSYHFRSRIRLSTLNCGGWIVIHLEGITRTIISAYHRCNTFFHWLETHHVQVSVHCCIAGRIAICVKGHLANKIRESVLISPCKLMRQAVIQTLRFIAL